MPIPALDTARLTLRGHSLADVEESATLWMDPATTLFITGAPSTRTEAWARVQRYVGHWALLGFGYWVIRERASGRFVGELGYMDGRRNIDPPLDGIPEIGWVLAPSAQGQGFALEATRAAIAWGDAHFQEAPTACLIDPQNGKSIKLAERCGYRETARIIYAHRPTIMFRRG